MAHVTEQAIKAWQAGWRDAEHDIHRELRPPYDIGKRPSAYILGYMDFRVTYAYLRISRTSEAEAQYNTCLSHFMENYDL